MSTLRIGGLASGMDIDSLVEKLMMAERAPLDKLEQKKQTYEWQRDAYRDVNTKLQTFDTYIADNLILKSLNTKTATSSNSAYVSATATGSASGTLTIEGVSQLATAARAIGTQKGATSSSKLSNIGITGTGSFELRAIKADGSMATKTTKIEYDENMTVSQLISKINSSGAGVNALFENGILSITAKNTGDNKNGAEIELSNDVQDVFGKLGLSASIPDANGIRILADGGTNAVFQVNGIATERSTNTFSISGYSITIKETFNVNSTIDNMLITAEKERDNAKNDLDVRLTDNLEKAITEYTQKLIDDYQIKLESIIGSSALNETEKSAYDRIKNKAFLSNLSETDIKQLSTFSVDPDANEEEIKATISAELDENLSPELKVKLLTLSKEQLVELSKLDETQLNHLQYEAQREIKQDNYNSLNKSFLEGLTEGEITIISAIDFSKKDPYEGLTLSDDLKKKLDGLSSVQKKIIDNLSEDDLTAFKELATVQIPHDEKLAAKETAEKAYEAGEKRLADAEASLIVAQAAKNKEVANPSTAPKISTISLTSTTNVDEIINKIKDFVNTYNGLIKDLNNLTKESKYRDYQPLTSAQRKEMEDNDIELWEKKAKSGLLRGDSIIQNGLSSMRSLIYQTNSSVANSKFNTLYNVGITTSNNYLEGGTLEIDETKLRAALNEDPDAVATLFSNSSGKVVKEGNIVKSDSRGYLQKLRASFDEIQGKIENRAGRSTMTQTQYTLGKYLKDVDDQIDKWQDKLVDIESRYWKQFSAMETMINKANSQSTMLSGLSF
ncbi:MAG TPA: flagellar filament capping protein FliD [Ureibacillus sp.]|nr:flagellar filament capping protein FliD [Ureibacillus sp.]